MTNDRSFPEAADGRPLPPMGDELMAAGLNAEDARFVARMLRQEGYYLVGGPHGETPLWRGRFDACAAGADLTTPEGRFAFDARLRETIATIEPADLRLHYEHFFRRARAELFLTVDAPGARLATEGEW